MLGVVGLAAPSMAHVPVATTSQFLGGNHKKDEITSADEKNASYRHPKQKYRVHFSTRLARAKLNQPFWRYGWLFQRFG